MKGWNKVVSGLHGELRGKEEEEKESREFDQEGRGWPKDEGG